jgi:hypothetical protein
MGFIYKPRHQKQIVSTDPWGKFNCSAYSFAMAVDRHTLGGMDVTGKQVRAATNEPYPDPNSPGLNIAQLMTVAVKWNLDGFESRRGIPWSSFIAQMKTGRGAILQGDYDQMGDYSSQASFRGDHAMFINHVSGDGDLFTYDPLAKAPREIPQIILRRYAEKFAKAVGTSGVICALTRETPTIAVAQ